MTLSQNWKYST